MSRIGLIRNVTLCEDIREEVGNKKSLMGVFGGDIIVGHFPASIRLAFYAEYQPVDDLGEHEVNFALSLNGKSVAYGKITVDTPRDKIAIIVIPQGMAVLNEGGEIVLTFRIDEESIEVLRKKVTVLDPSTPLY